MAYDITNTLATILASLTTRIDITLSIQSYYAQDMGTTDASGMVIGFPLRTTGDARRIWADHTMVNDNYNGLSPYPGFRLNGTGPRYQYGATGQGAADAAYGPKATLQAAVAAVPAQQELTLPTDPGEGNQVFLREGGTFADPTNTHSLMSRMGHSPQYPFCLQSYDPTAPLDDSKHGRALGGNRPKITVPDYGTVPSFIGFHLQRARERANYVFRGIRFTPTGATPGTTIGQVAYPDNALWENCIFDRVNHQLDHTWQVKRFSKNSIIRRSSFIGMHNIGRTGGLHSSGNGNMVLEDCLFDKGGWNPDTSRSFPAANLNQGITGGADIFTHNFYAGPPAYDQAKVRRCVMARGAATGASMRNNSQVVDNVFLFQPIAATIAGLTSDYNTENPNGSISNHDRNVLIGGDDIDYTYWNVVSLPSVGATITIGGVVFTFIANGTLPSGNQIAIGTDTATTAVALAARLNALYVTEKFSVWQSGVHRQPVKTGELPATLVSSSAAIAVTGGGAPRGYGFSITNTRPGTTINYNLAVNNTRYGKVNNGFITWTFDNATANGFSVADVDHNTVLNYTHRFSFGSDPSKNKTITEGSNNILSATSPATNDQIFAGLGYGFTSFDDAMPYMIERPEINWAQKIQEVSTVLFGHTFTRSTTAKPTITTQAAFSTQSPTVGVSITVTPPIFDAGAIALMQWFRALVPIAGTRGATTYTPVSGDIGNKLTFGGFIANGDADSTGFCIETDNAVVA